MRRLSRTLVGSPSGRPQGESSWSYHGTQGLAGIFPGARPRACKNLPRDLEESCHGLGWLWGPPRFTHSRKTNNHFFPPCIMGVFPQERFHDRTWNRKIVKTTNAWLFTEYCTQKLCPEKLYMLYAQPCWHHFRIERINHRYLDTKLEEIHGCWNLALKSCALDSYSTCCLFLLSSVPTIKTTMQ